ncbi:MAG TPA: heme o synthase [Candidatus Acidoferrum sp.]|nr:heme o synthase [Candidatus Acidoferrum sp.]
MIMKQKIGKYVELTKPKVTLLNLLVGVTCFVLAAFPTVDWLKLAVFAVIGYLAAGGCGVLNSVYDQDIDRLMLRTSKRAIPSGYVRQINGSVFGIVMIAGSFAISYLFFNPLTAIMVGVGAAFYLVVYTVWLKRISPWNVVIGGFAGCFAALSGWTAAVNTLSLMPLMVAMLDFLWTPGHLWGLAIKKMKEYKNAGIPMLPVTAGISKASKIVFLLNVLTVAFSFLLPLSHLTGIIYLVVAFGAGAIFLLQNRGLLLSASETNGLKVFLASMPYLTCLMLGLIVDKIILI